MDAYVATDSILGEDDVLGPWDPVCEQNWMSTGHETNQNVPWDVMCQNAGVGIGVHKKIPSSQWVDTKRLLPGKADDYQVSPASVDNVLGFWDRVAEGKTWSRVNQGPPLTETTQSVPYPAKLSPTPMGPSSAALSTTVASPEQPKSDMMHSSEHGRGNIAKDIRLGPIMDWCGGQRGTGAAVQTGETALFTAQLFVTAIADGEIDPSVSSKARGLLEQVRSKVSKEQNTVVQIGNEGAVDIKMRVFVANSIEAGAVSDYISSHPDQVPAPFVLLSRKLLMAVSYDPVSTDPSAASVADRLRKQIKTHAVKVLREAIADPACGLSTAALRGHLGALAPAEPVMRATGRKAVPIESDPEGQYIVLPPKNRANREERSTAIPRRRSAKTVSPGSPSLESLPGASPPSSGRGGVSAATSGSATPLSGEEAFQPRLSAHFGVNLFVTAIADGMVAADTPLKVQERLSQIVRKVPKEQNTSVEVRGDGTIDLKMRVFVVNSEDAKAIGDYVAAHMDQVPSPFVVLARQLPMAVLYDPAVLDLGDASVADRLRKQAKTRAVRILRESIGQKDLGVTAAMLRGYQGAMAPAERLQDALVAMEQPVVSDPGGGTCIVFAARNKAGAVAGSPSSAKRSTLDIEARLGIPDSALGCMESELRGGAETPGWGCMGPTSSAAGGSNLPDGRGSARVVRQKGKRNTGISLLHKEVHNKALKRNNGQRTQPPTLYGARGDVDANDFPYLGVAPIEPLGGDMCATDCDVVVDSPLLL